MLPVSLTIHQKLSIRALWGVIVSPLHKAVIKTIILLQGLKKSLYDEVCCVTV